MSSETSNFPTTVDDIFEDFQQRRSGLLKALTEELDDFYQQSDPERDNLCLYGNKDGTWSVDVPSEEVPPEIPEPCLGVNFARDGMQKKDWTALVAVHSDAWLMAVAFFYAVKLDAAGRMRLFKLINTMPTLFEIVTRGRGKVAPSLTGKGKRKQDDQLTSGPPAVFINTHGRPVESPVPSGKLLRNDDMTLALKGRQAELFWPDNKLWYLVEITNVNLKTKKANIIYATGEEEELDLTEIVSEGHMALLP